MLKKNILLVTILLLTSFCYGQQTVTEEHDDGTYSIGFRDNNGMRQGEWQKYYSSGKVFIISRYIDDILEGIVISKYKNGNIQAENNYIKGKLNGVSKQYDNKGKLIREISYQDNLIYGNCIYYEDGIIQSERYYKNGIEDGPCKDYDKKGNLIHEYIIHTNGERTNNICYKNGKKVSCNFF